MYYYVIADIHGYYRQLRVALDYIEVVIRPEDIVVFLGDYIDRGYAPEKVIDAIIEFPHTKVFLRGNHEQMFLNSFFPNFDLREFIRWFNNGGAETIAAYSPNDYVEFHRKFPQRHLDFIGNTLIEYRTKYLRFVHAGFLPKGMSWENSSDPRLWITSEFQKSEEDFGGLVVFGHSAQVYSGKPFIRPNKVGLDTGVCFNEHRGGKLTFARFEDIPNAVYTFRYTQIDRNLGIRIYVQDRDKWVLLRSP